MSDRESVVSKYLLVKDFRSVIFLYNGLIDWFTLDSPFFDASFGQSGIGFQELTKPETWKSLLLGYSCPRYKHSRYLKILGPRAWTPANQEFSFRLQLVHARSCTRESTLLSVGPWNSWNELYNAVLKFNIKFII